MTLQTVWIQSMLDVLSSLIWIQTIWLSKDFFEHNNFEKKKKKKKADAKKIPSLQKT